MKHKTPSIILAVLCAVGIHTVLFTDAGHRMQGAITESGVEKSKPDSYLEYKNGVVSFIISKDLKSVEKISASLSYDTGSIALIPSKNQWLWEFSQKNDDYSENIVINFTEPTQISPGTILASWNTTDVHAGTHVINLSEVSVESNGSTQSLNTRGTGTF